MSSSRFCQPNDWPDDVDEMALVYNLELTRLLDELIPARQVLRRPRHSDPWFDGECRHAKRLDAGSSVVMPQSVDELLMMLRSMQPDRLVRPSPCLPEAASAEVHHVLV